MIPLRLLLVVALFLCGSATGRATNPVDTLVDAAWRSWQIPDYALAEQQFRTAMTAYPSSERGYLGLALLQNMRENHRESWTTLKALADNTPQSYPTIFSFWFLVRFRLKDELRELGLLGYLEHLASVPDDGGVLSAQTMEALEEYYRERGDISESREWRAKMNAISDWLLIGPFENVSASGYDKVYQPESEFDPAATYAGKRGIPASWFPIVSPVPDTWVDFMAHFPFKQSIFYANTFVYSPVKRKVHLRIGTSGSLRAFLNDEMVIEYFDENNNDLDTYIVDTELQEGWNRLLIKCGCSEIDRCNFLVRITDEHGQPVEGLRVSTEKQSYHSKPSAPATVLESAFESFFMKQIDVSPDHPENYALLAQVYLRNDKAPQAELVLRSALRRWPRCTLFYTLMMEAYQRGEKGDETDELLTKVSSIDGQLPSVLIYRATEATQNEEYEKVEEILAQLRNQGYNPEYVYQMEIGLMGKRKEADKLVSLTREAYARYPLNWELANLQAVIESEMNHSSEKAAAVVEGFLKRKYGLVQLNTMAGYYLKSGNIDKWESTMHEALDLSPTSTGYFYSMGLVYQLIKRYAKAEEMFNHALVLCPNSSLYWSKLAEVYKSTDRLEEAKAAYRSGLKFDPRDFASRDALRELEGRKPVLSAFSMYSVDSLVHAAPDQREYENDPGVILLDDTKRVVFEQGASMVVRELLVKTFNTKGIDAWKEYGIGYNSYNEVLTVEKAVTIKKDGSEIKADVDDGQVVFKSLEPNDCLYLKWKVKNYYSGMLSKHFWDTHYFNGFYPVRIDRYALMVPKDVPFTHRTQCTTDEPRVREVADGVLYEWQLKNEPAIRYEQEMPGLQDIGKMLTITSLPSWDYVASWYSDLARTKTRSTFEIKDQVEDLFAGKKEMSDEERVRAIYDFITENIRYSSVSFRQSAYVPQRARKVLVQRLGDCKDVATLCIAMLNEAGIKAHYVLVNTWDDGYNRSVPPSIAFNHCIVGVDLKSGVRHIDLTASNYSVGSVPPVVNGAFSLAIEEGTHEPVYLGPDQFQRSDLIRRSTAMLNDDNSMTSTCASQRYGAMSAYERSRYRNKSEAERVKTLTEALSGDFPNVKVKSVAIRDIDRLDPCMEDTCTFTVPQFVSEAGGYKLIRMPWSDKLTASEALSYESR